MQWKHSFNRKKHQRAINKYVRRMNKNLYEDDLWQGRFYIRQIGFTPMRTYPDNSGAELGFVTLTIYDKKTTKSFSRTWSGNTWTFLNGYHVWNFVNTVLTDIWNIWGTEIAGNIDEYRKNNNFRDGHING